jgi:NarL family two-component system response regulator YdfI
MVDIWIMAQAVQRRDSLLRAVDTDSSIHVAGAAANLPLLRSMMSEKSADVALIDWEPQTESGAFREWLLDLLERISTVVICSEPDQRIFNRISHLKNGGMILYGDPPSSHQVIGAIKSVSAGLLVFDGALIPQRQEENPPDELLTPREGEVLRLLADGLGNKEIAIRLNVSEHTIKFHIGSILGKLGASSRTEAVTRGLRSGLIDL